MENKRKKYIHIESDISNNELFPMLDGIDSGRESDVESILNDSDTEFVSGKPRSKTADDTHDIFVPEANVYVASELKSHSKSIAKCYERRENVSLFMT